MTKPRISEIQRIYKMSSLQFFNGFILLKLNSRNCKKINRYKIGVKRFKALNIII